MPQNFSMLARMHLLIVFLFSIGVFLFSHQSSANARGPDVNTSSKTSGVEIFLYPGSEADIDAAGVCRHVRNTTKNTIIPFAANGDAWQQLPSKVVSPDGTLVQEATPCR